MLDWEGSKDNKKTGNIRISFLCGEEEGNEDSKCALFDPSARA